MEKITLAEYKKAQKICIDYFTQDFKKINGQNRPCIICNIKIKPIHPETIRFPQSGMYHEGIVDKIAANYGSNEDGNMYIIAICDHCLEKLKNENKIEYAGNYMQ